MSNHITTICVKYPSPTSQYFFVEVDLDYQVPDSQVDASDWDYYGSFDILNYSSENQDEIDLKTLKKICKDYMRDLIITECFFAEEGF